MSVANDLSYPRTLGQRLTLSLRGNHEVQVGHLETPVLRSTAPLRSAVEQEDWSLRLVSFPELGSAGLESSTRVCTKTVLAEPGPADLPVPV